MDLARDFPFEQTLAPLSGTQREGVVSQPCGGTCFANDNVCMALMLLLSVLYDIPTRFPVNQNTYCQERPTHRRFSASKKDMQWNWVGKPQLRFRAKLHSHSRLAFDQLMD